MRTILVLVATVAACVANTIPAEVLDVLSENAGREFSGIIQFPDGRGSLHLVDLDEEIDDDIFGDERDGERNQYWLYTRDNAKDHQLLTIDDVESVQNSNFDPKLPTMVVVHGWLSDARIDPCPSTRDAMLQKEATNVICVDWRDVARRGYVTSVFGVPGVGKGVARFLHFLNRHFSISYEDIHLVGLSLGGHVIGNIGRALRDDNGGPLIGRITSLDPAGPLWTINSNRIRPDDAIYTEAIHTDNLLGINADVCDVDIYMNGGYNMPGCLTPVCGHMISTDYFCATITHEHLFANECSSNLQISLNRCSGAVHQVGTHHMRNKRRSGRFRANTARSYPF